MRAEPPKHMLFWLVVHGSYGPGGDDHGRLAAIEGTWHPGSFSAVSGETFSDLIVKRYQDEPVRGWALQVAPKPNQTDTATTPAEMFDTWAALDEIFGESVVRMDTTFHFDESQHDEGDVCRANTYGSVAMVPDGRYDAPHPLAPDVELWHEVVAGAKCYSPSLFEHLISNLDPTGFEGVFGGLDQSGGFLARLRTLVHDQTGSTPSGSQPIDFSPQAQHGVDDSALIELAKRVLAVKSAVIGSAAGGSWDVTKQIVDTLTYRIAEAGSSPELGDVHYDLAELFADACSSNGAEHWGSCLAQACFALAQSYDLVYWLMQDWSPHDADLEPLYRFWQAGGTVAVDVDGIAHVTRRDTR